MIMWHEELYVYDWHEVFDELLVAVSEMLKQHVDNPLF